VYPAEVISANVPEKAGRSSLTYEYMLYSTYIQSDTENIKLFFVMAPAK
jgi:hypothetical protein